MSHTCQRSSPALAKVNKRLNFGLMKNFFLSYSTWKCPIFVPNCSRWCTYWKATSQQAWMMLKIESISINSICVIVWLSTRQVQPPAPTVPDLILTSAHKHLYCAPQGHFLLKSIWLNHLFLTTMQVIKTTWNFDIFKYKFSCRRASHSQFI